MFLPRIKNTCELHPVYHSKVTYLALLPLKIPISFSSFYFFCEVLSLFLPFESFTEYKELRFYSSRSSSYCFSVTGSQSTGSPPSQIGSVTLGNVVKFVSYCFNILVHSKVCECFNLWLILTLGYFRSLQKNRTSKKCIIFV